MNTNSKIQNENSGDSSTLHANLSSSTDHRQEEEKRFLRELLGQRGSAREEEEEKRKAARVRVRQEKEFAVGNGTWEWTGCYTRILCFLMVMEQCGFLFNHRTDAVSVELRERESVFVVSSVRGLHSCRNGDLTKLERYHNRRPWFYRGINNFGLGSSSMILSSRNTSKGSNIVLIQVILALKYFSAFVFSEGHISAIVSQFRLSSLALMLCSDIYCLLLTKKGLFCKPSLTRTILPLQDDLKVVQAKFPKTEVVQDEGMDSRDHWSRVMKGHTGDNMTLIVGQVNSIGGISGCLFG
ncbi:hypothetical protein IGI04_023222 [Brassica rapa subsp. trilocularis]|uniref:Uncharacterized protein n=1 Tax=Brassica rapa subsp. trilocularis TaxID=1813537 RepID=A0ABQ7M364_BRACM|nr:hypothetical protein IGI04_023222 [Brassica rapa subsp. trilocularis]